MDNTEVIQGTQQWKDARLGFVTASRIAAVIAKPTTKGETEARTRGNYRLQLFCERTTGKAADFELDNLWQIKRGKKLEPDARMEYDLRCMDGVVKTVGFVEHPTIPNFGCSPDALVGDKGMAQFKCPIPRVHEEYLKLAKKGQIPSEYYKQVQCELAVTGREWSDFVSYCPEWPEPMQLSIVRVPRDESLILQIEAAVVFFNAEIDEMIAALPHKQDPLEITDADFPR